MVWGLFLAGAPAMGPVLPVPWPPSSHGPPPPVIPQMGLCPPCNGSPCGKHRSYGLVNAVAQPREASGGYVLVISLKRTA